MFKKNIIYLTIFIFVFSACVPFLINAQTEVNKNIDLYISPRSGTFSVNSIFTVGVYVNTKNQSINTINLNLQFDPKKLAVVKPSGGNSIMGVWVESPVYDNKLGFVKMAGVVPEGVVTSSGLITTVSFKVIAAGESQIYFDKATEILLNDGLGTKASVIFSKSTISLVRPLSGGAIIYSDTHPFQDIWSNNNNPTFSWDIVAQNILGYSVVLDSKPNTQPPAVINNSESTVSFDSVNDGIQYLHVRANQENNWTDSAHYQIRVDTVPPVEFKPSISLIDNKDGISQYMVFFNTSDDTSGIDRYEVGVINTKNKTALPVFVQAESPYVLPLDTNKDSKIIVRAFDLAGNTTEAYVSVATNKMKIAAIIIGSIFVLLLILHYLLGHHIGRNLYKAYLFFRQLIKKDHDNSDLGI